jgi:hypothetical protein
MASHPRDIDTDDPTFGTPGLSIVLTSVGVASASPTLASIAAAFISHHGDIDINVASPIIGNATLTMQPKWFVDDTEVGAPGIGSAVLVSIGYNYTGSGFAVNSPSLNAPAIAQNNKLTATGVAVHSMTMSYPSTNIIILIWLTPVALTTTSPSFGVPDTYYTRPLSATGKLVNAPSINSPDITVNPGWFQTDIAVGSPQINIPQLAIVGATPERLVITLLIIDSPILAQTHKITGASDVVPARLILGRPAAAPVVYAFLPQDITVASPTIGVPVNNQRVIFISNSIQITSKIIFCSTDIGRQLYECFSNDLIVGSPDEIAPTVLQPYTLNAMDLAIDQL